MRVTERARLAVPEGGAPRLDAFLADQLPLSRSRLQVVIKEGGVTVDGAVITRARQTLVAGQVVELGLPAAPTTDLQPEDIPVPVLFIDDQVVVVDKPAGLVVHPAKGHASGTLVNALLHLLAEVDEDQTIGGHAVDPTRPGIVHRLDKGTSGVMAVARTPEAHAHLAQQFADRSADRRYLLLVWGESPGPAGTVDAPLARHPTDRLRFAVREGGRHAVTHWQRLAEARFGVAGDGEGGCISLLRCRLETGRTHQVRVHMAHLGLPLLGDPLYDQRRRRIPGFLRGVMEPVDHQLLHAARLGFDHPVSGQRIDRRSPPPADFIAVAEALGLAEALRAAVVDDG